jgi:hypothetical protein
MYSTEFHENPTNGLVADAVSHQRTEECTCSAPKAFLFCLVKNQITYT